MDYSLLQQHTVKIYHLENRRCVLKRMPARSLLVPQRFDLFAKLFYIGHVDEDPSSALKVYKEHIKAFNPDEKEPGRVEKNSVEDFVAAFNAIIADFRYRDFDDTISIVPVDKNGVILDGAHRVSALAFFDREVTVAQFSDVKAKCDFDYQYFMKRGLSLSLCDMIAHEMVRWLDNMLVACLWPRLGNNAAKRNASLLLAKTHTISYEKRMSVNLKSLSIFVGEIYKAQPWTLNKESVRDKAIRVMGRNNRTVWFVFFENKGKLEDIIQEKNEMRDMYGCDKDSLHITDNIEETRQIAQLTLSPDCVSRWNDSTPGELSTRISEKFHYFKNVTWMNLKTKVWNLIHAR